MKYEVNYRHLILLLLPTFLRQSRIISFLRTSVAPIEYLFNRFMVARKTDIFCESVDSSIPRLEYMLNSIFYPEGLDIAYDYRIIIVNLTPRGILRIFRGGIMDETDEGRPQFLNPVKYIYTSVEAGEIHADYVIQVPAAVEFDESRMRSTVNRYALPDKFFEIIKY